MSTMTYKQAQLQAVNLRKQGLTYPKIEEHLRMAGYASPKTKNAITALAVRHMIGRWEQEQKKVVVQDTKAELEDKKIFVMTDANNLETEIEALLTVGGLSDKVKNQLVIALIRAKREEKAETQANIRAINGQSNHAR